MDAIIHAEDLRFSYEEDASPVLDGLSLDIECGSFTAILGHNGSGKSTLAKLFNGILLPTAGRVAVNGIDTADSAHILDVRRTVGLVFQNPDIAARKAKMLELGDAFVAFPGGTGTLEEITEVMSLVSLGKLRAPCILYNRNGFYDHLRALLDRMTAEGLSAPERQRGIYFASSLEEIQEIIEAWN